MSQKSSLYKTIEILKHLNEGKKLCVTWLAEEYEVRDRTIRRYFILKKYLPSQKVVTHFENGDIEVQYRVTNLKELEELVIKWLPKIRIMYPRLLKKMVMKSLTRKMKGLTKKVEWDRDYNTKV